MTATLRYDIGAKAGEVLCYKRPDLMADFGSADTSRWGGVGKPRHECVTFAIKLPGQLKQAMDLVRLLSEMSNSSDLIDGIVRNSCFTLAKKIRQSLGLPYLHQVPEEEKPFIAMIEQEPSLTSFLVYADWLEERGDKRGELIRGWSGPKAIKCKYGIPLLAREETR